jgi:pimeloyl-ACP methyl ester carboxylesterase
MLRFLITTLALLLIVGVFWLFEDDLPAEEVDRRYSNQASRFLTTGSGARLHFRDQGNKDGLPVVLIPGANASLHTWEGWVDALGDAYRIVTLDLPAHGLTGRVPDADYGRDAQLRAVTAVADELGLQQFVLGGNSMGGGVTWRYALANPGRVMALVLVDSAPPPAWREDQAGSTQRRSPIAFTLLAQPWFRAVARYLDPQLLVAQGLRVAYHDSPVVDDALIARYRDLALRAGSREAILSAFPQPFAQPRGAAATDGDPAQITQPTLILWGAHDTLIDVEFGARFRDAMPDARLVVYSDLGHVPMEEAPARTAADVRAFLDAVLPAGR